MISESIKALRKRAGLTQVQLADKLNVSQSTIAGWESGNRRPDIEFMPKLADFFGVSVSEIYGDQDSGIEEYTDDLTAIRKRLLNDPSFRLLYDTATKARPEHLRAAAAMLKSLEESQK
jgi:transcriptional regulator with XRE-family HTH domain